MKYVLSYYKYPCTFGSVTVPAKDSGLRDNIVEITDGQLDELRKYPLFVMREKRKRYRVVDTMPDSYIPTNQLLNMARKGEADARSELEQTREQIAMLKARLEKLEPLPTRRKV